MSKLRRSSDADMMGASLEVADLSSIDAGGNHTSHSKRLFHRDDDHRRYSRHDPHHTVTPHLYLSPESRPSARKKLDISRTGSRCANQSEHSRAINPSHSAQRSPDRFLEHHAEASTERCDGPRARRLCPVERLGDSHRFAHRSMESFADRSADRSAGHSEYHSGGRISDRHGNSSAQGHGKGPLESSSSFF